MDHTLQTGAGLPLTLEQLGATSCAVKLSLGGDDSMRLTVSRQIDAAALFPAFAQVTLRDPAGVVRFRGVLTRAERTAEGNGEQRTYTFEGANYWLRRLMFQQQWTFVTDFADFQANISTLANPSNADLFAAAFSAQYVTRLVLNRQRDGTKVNVRDQVAAIFAYATGAAAPVAYNVGALSTVMPPVSQQIDLRCAEAIRNQLEWCPHHSYRWQYETAPYPTALFGDTTSGTTFGAPRTRQITGANGVTTWLGDPRWDLLSRQVVITYIYGDTAIDPEDPRTYYKLQLRHDDASQLTENGAYGVDHTTVVLTGPITNYGGGQEYTTDGEPVPADGLADSLHAAYKRPYYEMRWTEFAEEVDWSILPGQRWSALGATAEFATCETICQTVEHDLVTGSTTVQCGPPTQLGFPQRWDLLKAIWKRRIADASGEMQNGLSKPGDSDTAADTTAPSVASAMEPFHGYKSTYRGSGSAPADQSLRIVIGPGTVNNNQPSNVAQEFVMPANAATVVYVAGSFDGAGNLLSSEIRTGALVPDDPEGGLDSAPAESYCALFLVTTDATSVTLITQYRTQSLSVRPVVRSYSCDGSNVEYQWA